MFTQICSLRQGLIAYNTITHKIIQLNMPCCCPNNHISLFLIPDWSFRSRWTQKGDLKLRPQSSQICPLKGPYSWMVDWMSIDCAKRPSWLEPKAFKARLRRRMQAALHPQQSSRERAPCGMNHRLIVNVEYLILIARNDKIFLFLSVYFINDVFLSSTTCLARRDIRRTPPRAPSTVASPGCFREYQ